MLGDRHELDVREPGLLDVLGQSRGEFAIAQERVSVAAHPRPEMHFVNADRVSQAVAAVAVRHPLGVAPVVLQVRDHRRGLRRHLAEEGERVGLVDAEAVVARVDVVLVRGPRPDAGDEADPDAGRADGLQRRGRLVPAVEVAEDEDRVGARGPDGELGAGRALADARAGRPSFS